MKRLAILLVALPLARCSRGEPDIPVREIRWDSIFGSMAGNPSTIYCLLGSGFFMSPRSDDVDAAIEKWLLAHPEARAIPIATLEGVTVAEPDSRMTYVWIVDGTENLNLSLVKNGHLPAGTMESPLRKIHISRTAYESFLGQAAALEREARKAQVGIWRADVGVK